MIHWRLREQRRQLYIVEPEAGEDSSIHQAVNLGQTQRLKAFVIVIHDVGKPPAVPLSNQ
jgi:hypothetical protein